MNGTATSPSLHALLLLSDSALPLGSFAFSAGLESFLAHTKSITTSAKLQAFDSFLQHSLFNLATTALPYVFSAYRYPSLEDLETLDNDMDASTPCTVSRRASTTQGRALLTIWERALRSSAIHSSAAESLSTFSTSLKVSKPDPHGLGLNGHFAPLFGLTCRALGLSEEETAYLFLLNHAKAVLSASVRASVIGPYQSQSVLASARLQGWIRRGIGLCKGEREGDDMVRERDEGIKPEEAAVSIPVMDLWMGRHELLYSRIFNS